MIMGNKSSVKKPINSNCPICLEDFSSNNILLECSHQYHCYCIQKHCQNYLTESIIKKCPLCRKEINAKEIKKIFNNILILNDNPVDWNQNNTVEIQKIINSNIKFEFHYMSNSSTNINMALILFLSKQNPHKVNLYQPFYIYSPIMNHLEFIEHDIFNSNIYKGGKNIFNETISNLSISVLGYIDGYNYWKKLLYKILRLISKDSKYKSIKDDYKISNKYIRFLISDVDNIKTYDINDGTIENGFKIKNKKCIVLFKPFIVYNNENMYLINEINSLLYFI